MNTKRFFALTLALLMALLLLPPAPARAEATYPLTVEVFPAEAGTVVSGGGDYAPNSDFVLGVTPNLGWQFVQWCVMNGDVSVDDPFREWTTGSTGFGFTGGRIEASFSRIEADVGILASEGGSVNSGDGMVGRIPTEIPSP